MKKFMDWIYKYLPDIWGVLIILIISLLLCGGCLWAMEFVLRMGLKLI